MVTALKLTQHPNNNSTQIQVNKDRIQVNKSLWKNLVYYHIILKISLFFLDGDDLAVDRDSPSLIPKINW